MSKINKETLVNALRAEGFNLTDSEVAVNTVFSTIKAALNEGNGAGFVGFGSFAVKERAARNYRDPNTGKMKKTPAKTVVRFTPSKTLLEK